LLHYGGIYPMPCETDERCFHCAKTTPRVDHIIECEKARIHGECIPAFAETDYGKRLRKQGYVFAMSIGDKIVLL
jgi:hypothetical protein